ncbi:hypothetical protein [Rhizobium sp. R693]|uniref:hypothetical protein n=1 Tax=Rhizobium sp. R693 TaxID=1764276 RepID=UPI000B52997E|nr:hypothetical protein [Rhizobium sp. R693]
MADTVAVCQAWFICKKGKAMAGEYRLCSQGEFWSIIDQATQEPARLDGVPLSSMDAVEAKHMLAILKGIDRLRSASRKSVSMAKKMRPQSVMVSSPPIVYEMFEMLRPLTGSIAQAALMNQDIRPRRHEFGARDG